MLIKKISGLYWEWHSPQSPRTWKLKAAAVDASGDDYDDDEVDDDITRNFMASTTNKVLLGERNLVL